MVRTVQPGSPREEVVCLPGVSRSRVATPASLISNVIGEAQTLKVVRLQQGTTLDFWSTTPDFCTTLRISGLHPKTEGLRPKRLPCYISAGATLVERLPHEEMKREEGENGHYQTSDVPASVRTRTSRTINTAPNLEIEPKNIFMLHAFKRSETSMAVKETSEFKQASGSVTQYCCFQKVVQIDHSYVRRIFLGQSYLIQSPFYFGLSPCHSPNRWPKLVMLNTRVPNTLTIIQDESIIPPISCTGLRSSLLRSFLSFISPMRCVSGIYLPITYLIFLSPGFVCRLA